MKIKQRLPHIIVFLVAAVAYLLGGLAPLETALMDLRFRLLERDATGELVVVEIDARSLRELDVWPWPRNYHAALLDRLVGAGAREIALDIDLSSRSSPEADRELEQALERAGGRVILPVFKQFASNGEERRLFYTGPLLSFRRHARLASVNIVPESDGLIWRHSAIESWQESPVATMPALLTDLVDLPFEVFHIDYGIRPETLPRLSYVDVLRGNFSPDAIAGKKVIVGATAVELGDQFSVPVFRALPGPVIQAMVYETLSQGRALYRTATGPVLIVMALLVLMLGPRFHAWHWRPGLLLLAGLTTGTSGLAVVVQSATPLLLDTTPWILAMILSYANGLMGRIDTQDLHLLTQGLELRRKDAFMRRVVENTFDGVVTADAQGTIQSFNAAAERIFHREAQSVVGRNISELVTESSDDTHRPRSQGSLLSQLIAKEQPIEITGRRRHGEMFPMDLTINRMEGDDTQTFIVVARDVSARKFAEALAEKSQQRLMDAIECISEAFVLYDKNDHLLICNQKFRKLHRDDADTLNSGLTFEHIIRAQAILGNIPDAAGRVDEWVRERIAKHRNPQGSFEEQIGAGRWLRISERKTGDGGTVGILTNITDAKQRERALEKSKSEAELANRAKTEFLHNMSHELRTPLNAIIGFSEIMTGEMLGPIGTPQYKEYTNDIEKSGRHLLEIINDILDVSKIEAGKFELQEEDVNIGKAIDACLRIVGGRAEAAKLRLEKKIPRELPTLWADDRVVRQALINIMSNAVKFTGEGGSVTLKAGPKPDGTFKISVTDTGIGIPEDDILKVTKPFYQVDGSLERKFEGTGLGLHLVSRFMDMHGGRLEITSELGVGSTVTLCFPAERVKKDANVVRLDSVQPSALIA